MIYDNSNDMADFFFKHTLNGRLDDTYQHVWIHGEFDRITVLVCHHDFNKS